MTAVPGLRGVEHVAFTVPNVEEAVSFFVDVLGCEHPTTWARLRTHGNWMADNLDVHPRASIPKFALLRCANGANFEIFQYESPDHDALAEDERLWRSACHLYVDDMDAALARLEEHGVRYRRRKEGRHWTRVRCRNRPSRASSPRGGRCSNS